MDYKPSVFLVFLFLLSTTVLLSQSLMVRGEASIIRVPKDFPTIQEAINAAENGSTILVENGIYHEHIVLNKTLTLIGTDKEKTIVDNAVVYGDPKNPQTGWTTYRDVVAINVTADSSVINGLAIRNSTIGINLDHCNGSVVSGNNLTMNIHGVILDHSNESLVSDNSLSSNLLDGIEIIGSRNNTVSNNVVSSTWAVELDGAAGYGIHLSSSSGNLITGNIMTDSGFYDIYFEEGSTDNTISKNTIGPMGYQEPKFGQDIYPSPSTSGNNTTFENNFISIPPPFTPYTPWSLPTNNFWSFEGKGNYWTDYSGLDNGANNRVAGDGVGDTDLPWHGVENYPLTSPVSVPEYPSPSAFFLAILLLLMPVIIVAKKKSAR